MMILLFLFALDSGSDGRIAVAPRESLTVTVTRPTTPAASGAGSPIVLIPGLHGGS